MLQNVYLESFTAELASGAPTPGGGGASALAGALAASLASMVCNLTAGKKKYEAFEQDIQRILARAESCRKELLQEIEQDAEAFAPLAKAYSIPKDDPERDAVMEPALREACRTPFEIMQRCAEVIRLCEELCEKGSTLALSDVGVSAILARSAMLGASLNIFINIKSMKDRTCAAHLRNEAEAIIKRYTPVAERVFQNVSERLKG